MTSLLADLTHGVRVLLRRPTFTVVAVMTLGLGLGASVAMFTLVQRVVLRPLPFPDPGSLVRVYDTNLERGQESSLSSPVTFNDWRREQHSFAGLAAQNGATVTYTGVTPAEQVRGLRVSAEWFEVLGTPPARGRAFTRDEETPGRDRVAIVSHGFWLRFLGGDPAAVGRSLSLDGEPFEVVGVMPAGFAYPTADTEIWTPLSFDFDVATSRGVHFIEVLGRLAPSASLGGAEEDLRVILQRLALAEPEKLEGWGVRLVTLHESIVGSVKQRMVIYLGAVGLVLLIAGVNVTNLTMASAVGRVRELAVRSALGAGRWRLARQLVSEGLVLAGAAGVIGVAVAYGILRAIVALATPNIPRIDQVVLDGRALASAAALALVLGICLGLVPVFRMGRGLTSSLGDGARAGTGRGQHRMRNGFVVAQFAIALLLAVGAGLLARSYAKLGEVDPGYATRDGLVATLVLPSSRYPDPASRERFFTELTSRLEAMPGVISAAASTQLPLEGYGINFSYWVGDDVPPSERPNGDFRVVTPEYFETMGIPVVYGRAFTSLDAGGTPPVIIVDEPLARKHFGEADPVGRQINVSYGDGIPRTIVGVVGAVRQRALDVPASPGYYLPLAQVSWGSLRVVVHSRGAPDGLIEGLRREVAALDPLLATRGIQTLEQRFAGSMGVQRFNTFLLGAFSVFGLVLAVSGIYSVMSYAVTQRTREIGVRMALGAQTGHVRRTVSWSGVRLAAVGVGIGTIAALALTRLLSRLLFGVTATDPLTFAAAVFGFLAIGWLGSYLPARRASGVDPVIALRAD